MSAALRLVALVLGVLVVVLAAGVWVLGLMPESAPDSASEVLAAVGVFGALLAGAAIDGGD